MPHIEAIARILIVSKGHVLLCQHATKGYCYLPGGHIEFAETAADAVIREMMEEAGAPVRVGGCVLVEEHTFTQKGKARHELNIVFAGELVSRARDALPPVRSLESGIRFVWQPISMLHAVEVLPASHAVLLPALVAEAGAAVPTPRFVSTTEVLARRTKQPKRPTARSPRPRSTRTPA
jgi:8-oxo-dGTP diphosphatase